MRQYQIDFKDRYKSMININNQQVFNKSYQGINSFGLYFTLGSTQSLPFLKLNNQQCFSKRFQHIPPFGPYPTLGLAQSLLLIQ